MDLLFDRYSGKLYNMAYAYLKSREEAEEVLQNVLLKIWQNRSKIDASRSLEGYLFTIAKNLLLNRIRDRARSVKVTEELQAMKSISDFEEHSRLGNHDMWWAAPDKSDEMYGKDYVVKRLGIPNRYYSIDKDGWHFIMLDGNNKNSSLDEEQYQWLESDLNKLPSGTPTILMSHYPVLGVSPPFEGGMHSDFAKFIDLFYRHKDKVKAVLSGHNHLDDYAVYNGVQYYCNGSMSGFWWGEGNEKSAGRYYYKETPPGYAILSLYKDGTVGNEYIPHKF